MMDKLEVLKKYWGFDSFRELQQEVVDSLLSGCDTLVLMPTGGGKTITFQLPTLMNEGITIVVTPLISLMKDQVDKLKRQRISALSIHAGMSEKEVDYALDNCIYGDYKFLYVAPERLSSRLFRHRFSRMNVAYIAVDEAHCISQWGYDFRPSYLEIASLREIKPDVPVIALTASATESVQGDIISNLRFKDYNVFKKSYKRENLSYVVREVDDKYKHMLKVIDSLRGVGIIYVNLRSEAEEMAVRLKNDGYPADFYHAGLGYRLRGAKQESWIKEQTPIMVATNAFGMGIDKPNVRFVIHYSPPSTLENYYQEAGRAGRDGNESFAVLLYNKKDAQSQRKRLMSAFPSHEDIRKIYELLYSYYNIGIGGGKGEGYDFDIHDFCIKFKVYSAVVLSSIKLLQYIGYMSLSEEFENPTRIMFITDRDDLYRLQMTRKDIDSFVIIILRLYTGLFSGFVPIDEDYIARLSGYTREHITGMLISLSRLRVIKYIPTKHSTVLSFLEERLSMDNLRIPADVYYSRKESAQKRLDAVSDFLFDGQKCRSVMLCNYFGEADAMPCGKCDVCRKKI